MRMRQVFAGLHFTQATGRSDKFKRHPLASIQIFRSRLCRHHQINVSIIELINQIHQSARLIIPSVVQHLYITDKYSAKYRCDLYVVIR